MNIRKTAVAVAAGLLTISSFYSMWRLVDTPLFLTIISAGYVIAIYRATEFILDDRGVAEVAGWSSSLALVISVVAYLLITQVTATNLFSTGPNSFIGAVAVVFLVKSAYHVIDWGLRSRGGSGITGKWKWIAIIVAILIIYVVVFYGLFGGKWANVGGVIGEAGYTATGPIRTATSAAGSAYEATASQFDPCNNRRVAEIQCAASFYTQGAVFEATAGSTTISKCVEQKREQCEAAAESEQVTDPLIVSADSINIERLTDRLRVVVPVTNTLVTDRQGRPIDMPAENVEVAVRFKYLDNTIEAAKTQDNNDALEVIQNGDTASVIFNERGGTPYFGMFDIIGDVPRSEVRRQLTRVKSACPVQTSGSSDSGDDGDSGSGDGETGSDDGQLPERCVASVCWFTQRFPGEEFGESSAADSTDGDGSGEGSTNGDGAGETVCQQATGGSTNEVLNPERAAFYVRSMRGVTKQDLGALSDRSASFDRALRPENNLLSPERQYRVTAEVEYTYNAEAAFTQSSRWQSGNHLLKVWREDPWNELSIEEREQWRNANCNTVTVAGSQITKQTTAALTTPIIPVMYADCGGALFSRFSGGPGATAEVPIRASATVNQQVEDQIADSGFKIADVSQTCDDSADISFKPESGNEFYTRHPDGGFRVPPERISREVTVEGDSKTVGCELSMTLRANIQTGPVSFPKQAEDESEE